MLTTIAGWLGIGRSKLVIAGLVVAAALLAYLGVRGWAASKVNEGIRRERARSNERILEDVDRLARSDDALRSNPDRRDWLRKKYQRD